MEKSSVEDIKKQLDVYTADIREKMNGLYISQHSFRSPLFLKLQEDVFVVSKALEKSTVCNDKLIGSYCWNIIKMFETFMDVCEYSHNIDAAFILVRSIADRVAILKFVFLCPYEDERQFRLLLFALDAVRSRKRTSKDDIDTGLTRNFNNLEFEKSRIEWLSKKECELLAMLDDNPIVRSNPKESQIIINKSNWQYKTLTPSNPKDQNRYTYKQIYQRTLGNSIPSLPSHVEWAAQFVHGLFTVEFSLDRDNENSYDTPVKFAICLIHEFVKVLKDLRN